MEENAIERALEKFFSKSTRSDWKKMAMRETQGKDPFEILSWCGKDEILFLPYYDAQNVVDLPFLDGFETPATKNTISGPRSWLNLPAVTSDGARSGNSIALEHLNSGADGVLFDLRNFPDAALDPLMQNIEWPYCFLAFRANDNAMFSDVLSEFMGRRFDPAFVTGALFWESIPKKNNFDFYINHCKNFKALGLVIPAATPAAEISHALLEGIKTFEAFVPGSNAAQVLRSISFSIAADASALETAAKLKALRILWRQVALAYGHHDYNAADLHIHARSVSLVDGAYAPHENMLKGTFAAMAAILGGCDSLTVMSDQDPPHIPRWARNVSAILREESFFNRVSDPLAGSYAVDTMVNEIAKKAWEMFQIKWRDHETTT